MNICGTPWLRPARCAAIPHINPVTHPATRWIDCGEMVGHDNHIYLSDVGVREAMRLFGFATPDEVAELTRLKDEAEDALIARHQELLAAEAELEAIDLLTSRGRVRQKAAA